jgi:superfamily II DNA helicase RecQ
VFFSTVTLRFDPASGSFDDARFDEFAKSKELLAVKDHFFLHAGLPHLLLCVTWRMPPAGSMRKPDGDEEWRGLLTTPEAQERFDRLRRWRNERAKKDGIPAYAILTNRSLAEVAAIPAPTLAAFGAVEGFGPARVTRYAGEMLEVLGRAAPNG